jgi:putative serine/threonine protein kinase
VKPLNSTLRVPVEQLHSQPYAKVVCYPKPTAEALQKRLKELKQLGINAVEFSGEKQAFNVAVLGKGCVGIVVKAFTEAGTVALKIRRVDADRIGMLHEAEMLKLANSVSVGPKLLGFSEDFLVMEFIEGLLFPEWLQTAKRKQGKERLRNVLRLALEQCWRLDNTGLDHGELSHAPKHIIVKRDDTPCIVDFETASTTRRASNVTSLCQFFFIGSQTAKQIVKKYGKINETKLKQTLKNYKKAPARENFEIVLKIVRLL